MLYGVRMVLNLADGFVASLFLQHVELHNACSEEKSLTMT